MWLYHTCVVCKELDGGRLDVAVADLVQQYNVQVIVEIFFIQRDCFCQGSEWKPTFMREFVAFQNIEDLPGGSGSSETLFLCKTCNLIHSDRHSLAVAFSLILKLLFNGVGECMSEIQQHTFAGIKLIVFDYNTLDVYAAADDGWQFFFEIFKGTVRSQCPE